MKLLVVSFSLVCARDLLVQNLSGSSGTQTPPLAATLSDSGAPSAGSTPPPRPKLSSLSIDAVRVDVYDSPQPIKPDLERRPTRRESVPMAEAAMMPPKSREINFAMRDSEECLIFNDGPSPQPIKAATFSKLIERLCASADCLDPDDFLFSYRLFAVAQEVLEAIFKRYNSTEEKAIRIRIFNFFKRWIEKFWTDFDLEPQTNAPLLLGFVDPIITGPDQVYASLAKMIRTKIEAKQKEPPMIAPLAIKSFPAELINGPMGILDYSAQDIANQLSEIEWGLWMNIREAELIGLGWTKKNKTVVAPNVVNMTKRFNEVSDWVASVIITEENPKRRIKTIVKFIEVAECLKRLGNYNGVMEIFSAFQRGPVARLKKSFQSLDSSTEKSYLEITNLTNNAKNYSTLRSAIAEINPPVIPYLGMYLTDILFAIEGNGPYINGLINFFRCRLYSENVKKIKQYQLKGFDNAIIPNLYEKLTRISSLEENDLYTISNFVEPREGKEPTPRPDTLIDNYIDDTRSVNGSISDSKYTKKTDSPKSKNPNRDSDKRPFKEGSKPTIGKSKPLTAVALKKTATGHYPSDMASVRDTDSIERSNESTTDETKQELKSALETIESQKKLLADMQIELQNKEKQLNEQNVAALMTIVGLQSKLDALTEAFETYKKDHP